MSPSRQKPGFQRTVATFKHLTGLVSQISLSYSFPNNNHFPPLSVSTCASRAFLSASQQINTGQGASLACSKETLQSYTKTPKSGLSCFKCYKHTAQGFVPCSKRLIDWDAFDREPSRQATPLSGRTVMFSESRFLEHSLMVKWFMHAARDWLLSRCMLLPDSWRTWDYCKWCRGYFQKAEKIGAGSAHTNHCSVFTGTNNLMCHVSILSALVWMWGVPWEYWTIVGQQQCTKKDYN